MIMWNNLIPKQRPQARCVIPLISCRQREVDAFSSLIGRRRRCRCNRWCRASVMHT